MIYRNEIHEMEQIELLELIAVNALAIDGDEDGWVDVDEVIEALEHQDGALHECAEDDIIDSIYNGNWSDAAKQMIEVHIPPSVLVDYITDYRYEQYEEAYAWFDLSSAVAITQLYEEQRRVV